MGLDINSCIIIGYKIEFKKVESKVIRFNEETGQPYEKKILKIECSEGVLKDDNLDDFTFGYPDDEHKAIRGKRIKTSKSHRNVDDQIEMFLEIDFDILVMELNEMKKKYPEKNIKAYSYADASW